MPQLTDAGLEIDTLQDIKAAWEAELRARLGASITTIPESVFGTIVGIASEREAKIQELAQDIYNSQYPATATGISLDHVVSITGTKRGAPRRSKVIATLAGTNGTLIEAGKVASVDGTGFRFENVEDVTIGASPTAAEFQSEDFGPIVANSGTLLHIETPVAGWTGITNVLDATLGAPADTDALLRIRQQTELQASGKATLNAIRAAVLAIEDVQAATVFQNSSDSIDADLMPPHSVEAMPQGGDDQDVFDTVFDQVAAGIETTGTETGSVIDSQGDTQVVKFSRPELDNIKLEISFQHTADYPSDGDTQVKEAVVNYAEQRFLVGNDVILSALEPPVWGIEGIYDVTQIRGSIDPAAFGTSNIAIAGRRQAAFDTSRITLVKTLVTAS